MTLKKLTNENELINKLNNFNLAKIDYKETLPSEIKRKKESLINMIQDIQEEEEEEEEEEEIVRLPCGTRGVWSGRAAARAMCNVI